MEEDFFCRLDKYMIYRGLNDNQITVKANLPIGSIGKQRKGGRGLAVNSIAKILYAFDDLNADWLITGRGTMLKPEENEKDILEEELPELIREIIAAQRKDLAELNQQVGALKERLRQIEE